MRTSSVRKRGMSELGGTLITLVLVGLVIWGSIIMYKKFTSGKELLKCTAQEGVCTSGTCDWKTQIPILSGNVAGCDKNEICCVNRDKGNQADPLCMDAEGNDKLPFGTDCGDDMYCDAGQACVDKCKFCSTNVAAGAEYIGKVNEICSYSDENREIFENGRMFSCSCTEQECIDNPTQCVQGPPYYCGQDTAFYCCVDSIKRS
ncbi:MAG: hypothetical protein ACP5OA_07495 [Candidatus Woesearchaeota archaeon]